MISVVVNSRNEAEKLKKCLESVKTWADEIVVVDMQSKDNTLEIAKQFLAKVYTHKPLDYVEPVRKFQADKTKGKWVLILDPDEVVTANLKAELKSIAKEDKTDVVSIPRLSFIFGHKMKYSNFWPDYQQRFFKKGYLEFSSKIHSYPAVLGRIQKLQALESLAIQHYPYKNISEYYQRMKRYSDIEAKGRHMHGESFSLFNLFYKPSYELVRRLIRHMGFLDGWVGIAISFLQAYYYIMVEIKLLKLSNK